MKKYILAALMASTLIGCATKDDGLGDQLVQFRAERKFYDLANLRCHELVNQQFHQQLFGEGHLEGPARLEAVNSARAEHAVCTKTHEQKAAELWEKQTPEVHAFYDSKRPGIHAQIDKVNAEAKSWLVKK